MEAPSVEVGQCLICRVAASSSSPPTGSRCSSSVASWRRLRGRHEGLRTISLDLALGSTSTEVVVLGRRLDRVCRMGWWWQTVQEIELWRNRGGGEMEYEVRWQRCEGDKASWRYGYIMQLGFLMGWVGNFAGISTRTPMSPKILLPLPIYKSV